ncbi:hypothetical protein CB0940_11840 [Cercospora beticola]|uniref:Uncharacterized protein n=1 Tax=Cercospora beticola TaxID=122368 RepID=A0A2G5IED4_CERBT|nr:hypothetical protein CB0940_11840 [Cercospora beticola]PIB03217.1 hypothetical protein CB0940_11840 [Cercospora beticola]WPB04199.1 hypothetical protein RHO25_008844 [Cercospora beticola]CAK1356992.1 unnamed protein product [Cercospora beticola]
MQSNTTNILTTSQIVVLRLDHLRHYLGIANGGGFIPRHIPGNSIIMGGSGLDGQRSGIRCRIRDNVAAALRQDWGSLKKWYKPVKVVDATDARWLALVEQQTSVRERIETASKPSTDVAKKHMIIMALRDEFPELATDVPAPPEPQVRSPLPPNDEKTALPSYEAATAKMAVAASPLDMLASEAPNLQPPEASTKRKLAETRFPKPYAKKVKADDFADSSGDEDNGGDDDFDPKQERSERVAARGERRQRTEEKGVATVTVEQLERQREDLGDKYRLDDIQLLKKIAEIRGDKREGFKLVEEELNLKHKRAMEQARRKYSLEN